MVWNEVKNISAQSLVETKMEVVCALSFNDNVTQTNLKINHCKITNNSIILKMPHYDCL